MKEFAKIVQKTVLPANQHMIIVHLVILDSIYVKVFVKIIVLKDITKLMDGAFYVIMHALDAQAQKFINVLNAELVGS